MEFRHARPARRLLPGAALLLLAPLLAPPAHAAASYDGCTGFIASLPATISTQGVWCLDKDLNTPMASGAAISITANNVTIDCNGFKLGGLAAGTATTTVGIYSNRANISVRDCNIRGFADGVFLAGGVGGHRIERNRFQGNTDVGIVVSGAGSLVRDNLVSDTGGSTADPMYYDAIGIYVDDAVDVIDNQVFGVDASGTQSGVARGVLVLSANGSTIAGNRIGGLVAGSSDITTGIVVWSGDTLDIRDNVVQAPIDGFDTGVLCASPMQLVKGNLLVGTNPQTNCGDGGGNYGPAPIFP